MTISIRIITIIVIVSLGTNTKARQLRRLGLRSKVGGTLCTPHEVGLLPGRAGAQQDPPNFQPIGLLD